MDRSDWQRVRSILEQAVERPPEEREALLDQACGEDAALRAEVRSLLAAYADDTPFLDEPVAADALHEMVRHPAFSRVEEQLGPYRLIRELGRGGMGTVYLAERADGQFERRVAVKIVRATADQDGLLRRFRHERQILATLDHPHIARLLDGGVTPAGQPYLVMEYVAGVPIDVYCDRYRLTLRQRLDLFRTVCDAVHYAHRNLVVHRDLKPSNILVTAPVEASDAPAVDARSTAPGTVKLLDFGVAKLLHDDAADGVPPTRTGMPPMTLEYASPEQVRGQPITTASDVYALGVILYELLAGQRPYAIRGLTLSALERVICETDPPRPSTAVLRHPAGDGLPRPDRLHRRLRGDLDNIVLKALHKDPARRYGSAEQFSEDVRRYLAHLPVVARPHTAWYRVRTFVRRHTVGVLATLLITAALVGGIVATTHQAHVAERRFDQVRALSRALLFDLHDAIRVLPGSTPARQMLVTHALTYLDTLYREAGDDPSLQFEIAEAYERVGEIQGDPHHTNLGDLTGAIASYHKAFTLRQALWQADSSDPAVRRALANSYGRLAVVTSWSASNEDAIALSRRGLDLLVPLIEQHAVDPGVLHDAGRIRSELGWWLIWAGRIDEGLAHLATAERQLDSLARRRPEDLNLHLDLWRVYVYRLDGLKFTGRLAEALHLVDEQALDHLQALARRYPHEARVQYGLHTVHYERGEVYEGLGRLDDAARAYMTSLRLAKTMVAADSTNRKAYEGLGFGYVALARALTEQERLDEAAAAYRQAAAIRQTLYAQDRQNLEAGNALGNVRRALCRLLLRMGDLEDALAACRRAAGVLETVAPVHDNNPVVRSNLGTSYAVTARVHRALARRAATPGERRLHLRNARTWYDRSVAVFDRVQVHGTPSDWEIHPDTVRAERRRVTRDA